MPEPVGRGIWRISNGGIEPGWRYLWQHLHYDDGEQWEPIGEAFSPESRADLIALLLADAGEPRYSRAQVEAALDNVLIPLDGLPIAAVGVVDLVMQHLDAGQTAEGERQ